MAPRGGKKIVIVKKKVGGHGGHHGGSWKVAYADFVTAMMAFFMVMWILGMDDQTKKAVEGYFSNPLGFKKGYAAGMSPLASKTSPTIVQRPALRVLVRSSEEQSFEKLKDSILAKITKNDSLSVLKGLVDVQVTTGGLRIELVEDGSGDTFFPAGSAVMKSATTAALQLIGRELAALQHPVVLEGHTDAARFSAAGGAYTNWELSADRANSARRVLESQGLGDGRIVEVRGYAATKPRVMDDPMSASNRRISILLPYSAVPESPADAATMAQYKADSLRADISKRVP
jgi:chemotaxis protein MotB